MTVKKLLLALILAGSAAIASSDGIHWINNWKDVQFYLKPKFDGIRTFDQEFGFQSTIAKYGNLREILYACYDPTYPIRDPIKPHFATGEQTNYVLLPNKWQPAIYTKFKTNFVGTWRQETGFTARLYTARSFFVTANAAWLYSLPFKTSEKPQWLLLATLAFPL